MIQVDHAADLILGVRRGLEVTVEGFIGEVVVAERSEVCSAIVVMVIQDLRLLIRNVALRMRAR